MNTATKVALGASAFAATALLAPMSSTAATQHCELSGTKIEVKGERTAIPTDAPNGTVVCIKAGTEAELTTVKGGMVVNDVIFSQSGSPRGISYYVIGSGGGSGSGGSN